MENGVDTLIGNGGVRLSGGQAQRIALARTLCHKKPVLVLDDPFSALDISTEKKIYNNLCDIAKNNIVIIMTHRLYMFPKMDKVIWMDNGKAIVGTHEEIMLQCPQYRKLYENVSTQMRKTWLNIQKKVHYKIKIPTKIRKRSWIILSSNNVNSTEANKANNYNINNVNNKKMNKRIHTT